MLQTKRLTIRKIEEDDWEAIRNIWIDFNKSEYVIYDNEKNTDPENVKVRIAKWAAASRAGNEHMFFASCLDDTVIGFVSANSRPDGYEIGYGFLSQVQGHGYAKESLIAILDYLGELGAKRIYAGTALKNLPSVGLLNSVGFTLIETEDVCFHKDASGKEIHFDGGNFVKQVVSVD